MRLPARTFLLTFALCAGVGRTLAASPTLYSASAYEEPDRIEPGGLLMLAGEGLQRGARVVYQREDDETANGDHPATLPGKSTLSMGFAPVISDGNAPNVLTVRIPADIDTGRPYRLWVVVGKNDWSNSIEVGDARPLWFTPSYLYQSLPLPGMARSLRVVGRNLGVIPGRHSFVRLTGPRDYRLGIRDEPGRSTESYVAEVGLPQRLVSGTYQVGFSNDGEHWRWIAGQRLTIRDDPLPPRLFSVASSNYGHCIPDHEVGRCVLLALAAAAEHGGGSVFFPPGHWLLSPDAGPGNELIDGIVVPAGVNLQGAGAARTVIERTASWKSTARPPAFTLMSRNRVDGLSFRDLAHYTPASKDFTGPFLKLGQSVDRAVLHDPNGLASVTDVEITHNRFENSVIGIGSGGLPIHQLLIANNDFRAYDVGLLLQANPLNFHYQFQLTDAVVRNNRFEPGAYLDLDRDTGSTASQIGASRRLDFSKNSADGRPDRTTAQGAVEGWRAAFFWNLSGPGEELLISANMILCPGDRIGDGEAIALDNNGNTFGLNEAQPALEASTRTVSVRGPLLKQQFDRDVPASTYYVGRWIQVASGPGLGQTRLITGYHERPGSVEFSVAPAWDVVPTRQSRVLIGREFWQTYLLANTVDQRRPPCLKSNRTRQAGGEISIWAQTAEMVIAGNQLFDTDGILVHDDYSPSASFLNYFDQIRDNLVTGAYRNAPRCSSSGIAIDMTATGSSPPPTLNYGLIIADNRIEGAFNQVTGGAIAMPLSGATGPAPGNWPLIVNPLIFGNRVTNESRRADSCIARADIAFPQTLGVVHPVVSLNCASAQRVTGLALQPTVLLSARQDSCGETGP